MKKALKELQQVEIKKTLKELQQADVMVAEMYKADPALQFSKFGYAWKKFYEKNLKENFSEFNEELIAIRLNNALEDEKTKAILTDETNSRGFKFSKEGFKKCREEENAALKKFEATEIKVEPYLASYVPVLTDDQKEILTGLII